MHGNGWIFGLCLFWFFRSALAGEVRNCIAESWTTYAAIQKDGSLWVTDTVQVRFKGGSYTELWRYLPRDGSEGLTDISAQMDGSVLPPGKGPGRVEISGNDPKKIVWRFPSTAEGLHRFVLKYRFLERIRREENWDRLIWDILPSEREYAIASLKVQIAYPPEAEWAKDPHLTQGQAEIHRSSGMLQWEARDLSPDRQFTIELCFRSGMVGTGRRYEQGERERYAARAPIFIAVAVGLLACGLSGLFFFYRRYHPEVISRDSVCSRLFAAPEDLPPALAGILLSYGAQIRWTHGIATLVNLAQRGYLHLETVADHRWYQKDEFVVKKTSKPSDSLLPFERKWLAIFFTETKLSAAAVNLPEGLKRIRLGWKGFSSALKEEMHQAGMLSPEREAGPRYLMWLSLGIDSISIPLFIACVYLQKDYGGWPFLIPAGLVAVGIAAWTTCFFWSPLSDAAKIRASVWKRFCEGLQEIICGRSLPHSGRVFEDGLPYAVGFGLGIGWCKHFQLRGDFQIPSWFQSGSFSEKALASFNRCLSFSLSYGE